MTANIPYGTIVAAPFWQEPVRVHVYHVHPEGGAHVVGELTDSNTPVNQNITAEQAVEVQVITAEIDFTEDARHVFLALEAKRYQHAARYDPTFAISVSKVDPLPHQIEAVARVLKQPRIRFLIADDPGAGKTIMAGLIAKELKLRSQAKRILIVAPGHLTEQWIQEMRRWFEENFIHVNRDVVNAYPHENVWERESQMITAMDFARQEDIRNTLAKTDFDLIIVDEAHKMAAYQYGDKVEKTKRYQLGECLSGAARHLLFLTATPHRGNSENFRLFLDLLEPGFFADAAQIRTSIAENDNPLFIRRLKEDLTDFDGKPLFLPRYVQTRPFRLGVDSEPEMLLYNKLSEYIREQYNRFADNSQKRHNVAFALVILQRRLASSTHALLISLRRRLQRLTELQERAEWVADPLPSDEKHEDIDDLSEAEREALEAEWEVLSVAENREELRDEIETLQELERGAQRIIDTEGELKLQELKKAFEELTANQPDEKLLIFTEYADTLAYLAEKIEGWGFSVAVIHGGLQHDKRLAAQEAFRTEKQVLIATEAAGEGINLQFCHLMINYDLPWNPNRLEQRMGRIHRYGQNREVHIVNLVASDTREGAVFNRLFEKLETIRQELGTDNVYDVIGELFPKRSLAQIVREAAASLQETSQLATEIEATLEPAQLDFLQNFNRETLVSRHVNLSVVNELQQYEREHGLIPEYTREFFRKTFALHNVAVQEKGELYSIPHIPRPIGKLLKDPDFQRQHPTSTGTDYREVRFEKGDATADPSVPFISFGHPLFEATLQHVTETYTDSLKTGACFEDPDGQFDGVIAFYEGEIHDGADVIAGKRLFAFYVPQGSKTAESVHPALLWNFQAAAPPSPPDSMSMQAIRDAVEPETRHDLEVYRQELVKERKRHVEIKRKYGLESLRTLIDKLDDEILVLDGRQEAGDDVRLARHNKAEQKQRYEADQKALETACQQDVTLFTRPAVFVGAVRVRPAAAPAAAYTSSDIERIGMEEARRYEEARGWRVEDVAAENVGFDLRSTAPDGKTIRCIEVKARSEDAPVVLTKNEWFRARLLKDSYFLYVVLNAATDPELHIIQDPANSLRNVQEIAEVRYHIPLSEIRKM